MSYDRKLLEQELTRDESCRDYPYQDSKGIWTAGIGHNLEAHGIDHQTLAVPIQTATIEQWLQEDIQTAEALLDAHLPWWRSLSDVRQRVILNMCFNLGWNRLSQFHRMLACASAGQYDQAAVEMLNSLWAQQVGARAQRLAEMMRSG